MADSDYIGPDGLDYAPLMARIRRLLDHNLALSGEEICDEFRCGPGDDQYGHRRLTSGKGHLR